MGQLDGLTVRRVPVGVGPGFLSCEHRGRISQALGRHQALKSRQPVLIITRAVVRFAAIGCGFEFLRECRRPLFPSEMTCSESLTARANDCASQGSAKTGPPGSRGSRGNSAGRSASGMVSGRLKVVLPHVDEDGIARRSPLTPQLSHGKAN